MIRERKVCELSAAELLEAAVARMAGLGWTVGRWRIELQVEDGHVVRAVPVVWDEPPLRASVGRRKLDAARDDDERAA